MADFLPLAERALEQLRLQRPGRGQVSKVLPRLEGGWQDKLLLASEYSSPDFYGYMEGGLNRSAVLASRLARQFNLAQSG